MRIKEILCRLLHLGYWTKNRYHPTKVLPKKVILRKAVLKKAVSYKCRDKIASGSTGRGIYYTGLPKSLLVRDPLSFIIFDNYRGYLGPGGLHESGKFWNCTGGAAGRLDQWIFGQNHIYQDPTCQV